MLLCVPFLAGLWVVAYANPVNVNAPQVLEDRETPCIALGDCPGDPKPRPSSSSSTPPPSPPPAPPTSTVAAPASTSSGDVAVQTPVQRIFLDTDTCSDEYQTIISTAWGDAGLLARAAAGGRLDYDYTIPKTEWLGKDWNWPGWFPFSSDYRDIIIRNINRQTTLHTENVANGVWIYISCPKQSDECSPGTIAASADQNRLFWKNHYTVFCPLFFQQKSLSASLDDVRGDVNEQQIMDNYWGNQGYSFFHESYHYGGTVSQPRTADYCYKAAGCWEMAADKHKGTGWAYQTADSYSLEAMAIYAQQYFNTPHPPVPRKYTIALQQDNTTLYNEAANPSNSTPPVTPDDTGTAPAEPTLYYKALTSVPQDLFGSTNNVNAAGSNLDPRWKLMAGPPLPASQATDPAPSSTPSATTSNPPLSPRNSAPGLDMSSTACQSCMNDLGASDCAASDYTCLVDQCESDTNCQICNFDCSSLGS